MLKAPGWKAWRDAHGGWRQYWNGRRVKWGSRRMGSVSGVRHTSRDGGCGLHPVEAKGIDKEFMVLF